MNKTLEEKLKTEILNSSISEEEGIPILLNKKFVSGDNQKYMKMYNWMSKGYDIVEKVVGKFKYGNNIRETRKKLMNELEWKNSASVLYVSIGTGTDLKYIPPSVDLKTLDIVGVDLSIGMLKKCKENFKREPLHLTFVNACAEDLPFKENSFDIVFHVGGINFFNDKSLAIAEMLRVAKKGTKIMIADETSDYIEEEFKKSFFAKKYFKDQSFSLDSLIDSIPKDVKEKKVAYLWDNRFYCITFRKP